MSLDRNRPRPRRRLVILGSSGLLALAGAAGIVVFGGRGAAAPAHAASAPAPAVQLAGASVVTAPQKADAPDPAETPGPETDTVQSGPQGVDPAPAAGTSAIAGTSGEAGSVENVSDGPGGYADTVANAQTDQQGEH